MAERTEAEQLDDSAESIQSEEAVAPAQPRPQSEGDRRRAQEKEVKRAHERQMIRVQNRSIDQRAGFKLTLADAMCDESKRRRAHLDDLAKLVDDEAERHSQTNIATEWIKYRPVFPVPEIISGILSNNTGREGGYRISQEDVHKYMHRLNTLRQQNPRDHPDYGSIEEGDRRDMILCAQPTDDINLLYSQTARWAMVYPWMVGDDILRNLPDPDTVYWR
jgi:hypothetical protein